MAVVEAVTVGLGPELVAAGALGLACGVELELFCVATPLLEDVVLVPKE